MNALYFCLSILGWEKRTCLWLKRGWRESVLYVLSGDSWCVCVVAGVRGQGAMSSRFSLPSECLRGGPLGHPVREGPTVRLLAVTLVWQQRLAWSICHASCAVCAQSKLLLVEGRHWWEKPRGREYCNQLSQTAALGGSPLQPSLCVWGDWFQDPRRCSSPLQNTVSRPSAYDAHSSFPVRHSNPL